MPSQKHFLVRSHPKRSPRFSRQAAAFCAGLLIGPALFCAGLRGGEVVQLAEFSVSGKWVANESPAAAIAMPVSGLRFEPRADVQARGFAEGQADLSVRGGTFESIGLSIGGLPMFDPQTGHYAVELPVAPQMLGVASVRTGSDWALNGWNAMSGGIAWEWREIKSRGELGVGAGENHFLRGETYLARANLGEFWGMKVGADFSAAYSESDGSRKFGDHEFWRLNARVQLRGENSQTDFFAGFQKKFIGLVNLYAAPYGSPETDDLETSLLAVSHRVKRGSLSWKLGAYWRRNDDEYQFNRFAPTRQYVHRTDVFGAAAEGSWIFGENLVTASVLRLRAGFVADNLDSQSLLYGDYDSRWQSYAGAFWEENWRAFHGIFKLTAGGNFDATNRGSDVFSPLAELAWQASAYGTRVYVSYAEATQLPSYTALNSSPASGLFRGNAKLGRARSKNIELGARQLVAGWEFSAAVFFRKENDLVDWIYPAGVAGASRAAVAMDVDVLGVECAARRLFSWGNFYGSYAFLHKTADYGGGLPGGATESFYSMNFPEHRLTAGIVVQLCESVEARLDNELRRQSENSLRTSSRNAVLSSLGIFWSPKSLRGVTFSAQADNLWSEDFQEVPLVLPAKRECSVGVNWRF